MISLKVTFAFLTNNCDNQFEPSWINDVQYCRVNLLPVHIIISATINEPHVAKHYNL